jgi:hypothetical protein
MGGLIHNLDKENLLLLYLADELTDEDRAGVEHMLGEDALLRAQLDGLRAAQTATMGALGRLDAAEPLTHDSEVVIRRVMRDLRRHRLVLAQPPAVASGRHAGWPWWLYPVAAAAAVLFILLGLWGAGTFRQAPEAPQVAVDQASLAADLEYSFGMGGGEMDDVDRHLETIQGDDDDLITDLLASEGVG